MSKDRIVFVIGAGAGVDIGMPTGVILSNSIASATRFYFEDSYRQTSGSRRLYDALRSLSPDTGKVFGAGRLISDGISLSMSIDDFLYNHGEDAIVVRVGKTAIAEAILDAERASRLFGLTSHDPDHRDVAFGGLQESWMRSLFARMTTGVRRRDVATIFDQYAIINFNYDRCVEVFLHHALQRAYGMDVNEAASIVQALDITHPYGTVGRLEWQPGDHQILPFGSAAGSAALLTSANEIKTFTEQSHGVDERWHWQQLMATAELIVFLGFGFHEQNVQLLAPDNSGRSPPVFSTAYGASPSDQHVFRQRIDWLRGSGSGHIEMSPLTCSDFVAQYGLRIMSHG